MYIWNKQTATGAILDRRHINCYFLIKELQGSGLVINSTSCIPFENPRAGIRVLAITSQDYKQIIFRDIVGYCFLRNIASTQSYPSTYDVWRIKYMSLNRDISSVCLFFLLFLVHRVQEK